jgi:putative SOS response-associated peptidase YedK
MRPFPAPDMEMWPITVAVGNVKNTGPELIEPIGAPIEGVELV